MTNAELNTALYRKMFAEQEAFKAQLLSMTPQEILDRAYEYVSREDILLAMENNDLTNRQAKALLKSETPLGDVFTTWEDWETDHMEDVWAAVESRANEAVRAEFLAARREER